MKKIFIFLLLFLSHFCFSQNLVPNGSFEDTVSCPIGASQINLAVGWSSYGGSPDYFNVCNTHYEGTPSNYAGFQYAKSGNAYAGIIIYYSPIPSYPRENIGIQLTQPLVIGQQYYSSFYVAMAFNPNQRFGIASNKIGMRLSTISFSEANPVPIDNYSQVYTDSVITDTLNWTKISGSFVADSAYTYLTIGNFFDNSHVSRIFVDASEWYSYYYIDNVILSTDSNCCTDAVSSIHKNNFIDIFPNPARDWISIRGNDIQSLVLYDVLGRIAYSSSAVISPVVINTSSFQKGVYYLEAETKNTRSTQRIILV